MNNIEMIRNGRQSVKMSLYVIKVVDINRGNLVISDLKITLIKVNKIIEKMVMEVDLHNIDRKQANEK